MFEALISYLLNCTRQLPFQMRLQYIFIQVINTNIKNITCCAVPYTGMLTQFLHNILFFLRHGECCSIIEEINRTCSSDQFIHFRRESV